MPSRVTYISLLAIGNSNANAYLDKGVPIVSTDFRSFTIDQKALNSTMEIIRSKGFEVGPLVGISFSISGEAKIFKKYLNLELIQSENNQLEMYLGGKPCGDEIKGIDLPEILKDVLYALVIPTPPSFGPVEYP